MLKLPGDLLHAWRSHDDEVRRLELILCSNQKRVWELFGGFCARTLASRRRLRQYFEKLSGRLNREAFGARKRVWTADGRWVCRHGVFWEKTERTCPCMSPRKLDKEAWTQARYMPHLRPELKAMVAVPFSLDFFERLGILQARARLLHW